MKIHLIKYTRSLSIQLIATLLLLVFAQNGTAQQYNDTRVAVILPNVTQTQRPGEATVSEDTRTFCRADTFFFISSSTTGRKVNHDYSAYLQFSLASIPEGAIIDTVDLLIYLKKVKNTSAVFEQGVNLYELNRPRDNQTINIADSSSSAMSLVSKNDISQAIHLRPDITNGNTWVTERKGNFYCILAAEEAQTYGYYTERSDDMSRQPKLVISYHMPADQIRKKSWPQYKYDAQHTAMQGWQSNTNPTSFRVEMPFFAGPNYIKSDPILNDDKLMMYYVTSTSPAHWLLTLSQRGKQLGASSIDGAGVVKYGPVADRKGYAYCLTGNTGNLLNVFDPNSNMAFSRELANHAQATATPVIGFDGSIYISTDKGVYAYTAQPEFKLKWVYTSGTNKFGTPALHESEQLVYVYDGAAGKLIALNNADGVMKWNVNVMTTFATDIPVPSVKHNKVCITNGLRRGSSFHIVNAFDGSSYAKVVGEPNKISQPVIGTNNIYIINNGRLEAYSLADGGTVPTANITGLNPASTLAIDGNDNIFILNTEQGQQSLTVVSPGSSIFPSVAFPDSDGYLTGNRLMIAPDGSLIAGNDNHVYTIVPTGFALKGDITVPDGSFKSEYLYRADGIVKVSASTIANRQNVVIHGGKGISFRPGFSIQRGATLVCKTGL